MKNQKVFCITIILFILSIFTIKSQDEIVNYSYFQITNAWYITASDTLDVTESFSDDFYFAFFLENQEEQQIFTIRSYANNEIFCFGTIAFEYSEEDGDYRSDIFSTDVYCDQEQEQPVQSIILENIPGSEEETGYSFYYIWVVMNSEEALVFQCFDATNLGDEEEEGYEYDFYEEEF
jgi:hypothetical protein